MQLPGVQLEVHLTSTNSSFSSLIKGPRRSFRWAGPPAFKLPASNRVPPSRVADGSDSAETSGHQMTETMGRRRHRKRPRMTDCRSTGRGAVQRVCMRLTLALITAVATTIVGGSASMVAPRAMGDDEPQLPPAPEGTQWIKEPRITATQQNGPDAPRIDDTCAPAIAAPVSIDGVEITGAGAVICFPYPTAVLVNAQLYRQSPPPITPIGIPGTAPGVDAAVAFASALCVYRTGTYLTEVRIQIWFPPGFTPAYEDETYRESAPVNCLFQ